MNHESNRPFFGSTAAQRTLPTSRPQRAFSVVSSRWFKRWTRRDHSDDPDRVNFNDQNKVNDPDKVNFNDRDKVNDPVKDSALAKDSGPGGWTERVAGDQA